MKLLLRKNIFATFADVKYIMNKDMVLQREGDPMGAAIYDYHVNGCADTLIVRSSMFEDDEIPVSDLFRTFDEMPELEKIALEEASGAILDVGAGSGCHSIALMKMEKKPVAIDKFDTVLMLMNGTGIIGTLDDMPAFFSRMKQLLNPGGSVLIDSSDLRYLFEEEDGSLMIDLADDYYGQLDYQMLYKDVEGEPFDWLYVDFDTLAFYAEENGFYAELIAEGEHYDYLARLTVSHI